MTVSSGGCMRWKRHSGREPVTEKPYVFVVVNEIVPYDEEVISRLYRREGEGFKTKEKEREKKKCKLKGVLSGAEKNYSMSSGRARVIWTPSALR